VRLFLFITFFLNARKKNLAVIGSGHSRGGFDPKVCFEFFNPLERIGRLAIATFVVCRVSFLYIKKHAKQNKHPQQLSSQPSLDAATPWAYETDG
jgi:hypothetical protein